MTSSETPVTELPNELTDDLDTVDAEGIVRLLRQAEGQASPCFPPCSACCYVAFLPFPLLKVSKGKPFPRPHFFFFFFFFFLKMPFRSDCVASG